ncbi:MAG: hypothetical protein P8J59_03020 [Phycisphaerales bacterium]|jgi:hypothetical protein|nr:hypothetical protein [Phycisphaerales bacterium]
MPDVVLLVQIASTGLLTGLIWTIQMVHYPLFAAVGDVPFADYQHQHSKRITVLVGPLMLLEAASAALLVGLRPTNVPEWIPWAGLALVIVIWLSTALIQVPCHTRLAGGFDSEVHQRLVRSNWIRTIAWSARMSVLLLAGWLAFGG